ncbi:hypothetical protein BBO99_00007272 [Phytophthora kernoviae]|uniref:Uncharacterized protein n=2 Tax=Phytophthora kernoviae TaxID=325452 RepID=A0A421ETS0_9STRA|nr:hypothetical protein G195_008071 [Phytophthora kernoviae 00238/432]KAG2521053.1 hypothetical protein JM18_006768 [Phytophthora kernoviae]KAG2522600.1 hypothetical protein JM16_003378 [Phytophthora kernoviae]RLN01232.1 hypothetical protein BBI17_007248 [Phytophthora kernoviae]RLN76783.1 hypothetical protein BBO99_00007272 [Phytophthora kernoviae]
MKLLSGLLSLGALQLPLGALGMRASVGVKETLMAESRERSVSFAAMPFDLSTDLLLSNDVSVHAGQIDPHHSDIMGPDGRIKCTESESIQDNGEVTVVLAFSKCLNDTALGIVEQWVNQVKTTISTVAGVSDLNINFQSTMVPGACEERSEQTKQGLGGPTIVNQGGTPATGAQTVAPETATTTTPDLLAASTSILLADQVHPNDLKRLEAFPAFGDVMNLADDDIALTVKPLAVISFVTGEKSYGEVMQFEASAHVSKTFNFQICHGGTNCEGTFENCVKLEETVDLFMYNPFTVTRSLQCADLDGGVPVTYMDDYGTRQCFCSCPAGHELHMDDYGISSCVQVVEDTCPCVWATCDGFKHKVETDEAVCSFRGVATKWGLPVPFPTDGYVSDKRTTLTEGFLDPRITLKAEREQDAEYKGTDIRSAIGAYASLPLSFAQVMGLDSKASSFSPIVPRADDTTTHSKVKTWKDYQVNRDANIDDFEFTSYGKYHLEVTTTTCPKSFCDYVADPVHCTDSAELTEANLDKAASLADQYFDFADKAKNDACSVNNRCDSKEFSQQDFFSSSYTSGDHNNAHKCFNKAGVISDLLVNDQTKSNPLITADAPDNTAQPVPAGQCTRCCKMETALKEWWTDYRCGSDYDARYCEGDASQTCEFKQCLVVNGDTLATVTASITEEAKTESDAVLSQVEQQGYQTVTQIHRALDCTSFGGTDGRCDFTAKLSELIDTTEHVNFDQYEHGDPTEYIYWRFKLITEGSSWQLWKTAKHDEYDTLQYNDDDVQTFTAPETKIVIEAWTQCGLVRRFFFYVHLHVNSPVDVCDKFSDMWYQTTVSRLPIGTGICAYPGSDFAELTFDFHPNVGLQYSRTELRMKVSKVECTGTLEGRKPVTILSVTENSPEIVTRFAVTMLEKPTTEAATNFHVECAFMYTAYSGTEVSETCKRDFSISDCKGPAFDTPNAVCEYDECAGNDKAGLYEACGGTVIKADETCTIVEQGEKECCQGCANSEITCTALLNLPNADADIKRCEPNAGGAYASSYAAVLLTQAAQEHPAVLALLSTTALIAVVALVVVRRRVVHSYSAQTVDDAYYPLLH